MKAPAVNGVCIGWTQKWETAGGAIRAEDGTKYVVVGGQVEADSIGRTFLTPGEPVTFDPVLPEHSKFGKHEARNVRRPFKETRIDYRKHREIALVQDENWIIRQVGGRLSIKLEDRDIVIPDSVVEIGVEPNPGFKTWLARNIVLLARSIEEAENLNLFTTEANLG